MERHEEVLYGLLALVVWAILAYSSLFSQTAGFEVGCIILSFLETVHWRFGLKVKVVPWLWAGLVFVSTVMWILKKAALANI